MNIFKTFETFFAEPLSMIRNRIIQIVYIESNIFSKERKIDVDITNKNINLSVYGSKKVYNLLSNVMFKRKQLENENKNSKVYN